jgi:dihydrofolate reductase
VPQPTFAARGFENIGAWILGRNMFGPMRGPWPDDSWFGRRTGKVLMA